MTNHIQTGAVHHVTLTVTDVSRALDFYTRLLGFQEVADYGPRKILHNGSVLLAVGPAPDPAQALDEDRFSEHRVGLDHISFSVGNMAALEAAAQRFDQEGVERGEIRHLEPFGIHVMAFRDPDNIQLELTAPHEG